MRWKEVQKEKRLAASRKKRNAAEKRMLRGKWKGFELLLPEGKEFDDERMVREWMGMQAFTPEAWDYLYSLSFDAIPRAVNMRYKVPCIDVEELRNQAVLDTLLFWQDWPVSYNPTREEIHLKLFLCMNRSIGRYIQTWKRVTNGGRIDGKYPEKIAEEDQKRWEEQVYYHDLVEAVDAIRELEIILAVEEKACQRA